MPVNGQHYTPDFDAPLTNCPVCFSDRISWHKTDYKGIRIYKCRDCRIEFMNPQYTDEYLSEFYTKYLGNDDKHHYYKDNITARSLIHNVNLKEIEHYIKPGRFLSIGTGNGLDLSEARKLGWQAEGYDVDTASVKLISDNLGFEVKSGKFAGIEYPEKYFDCVYVNHVLEHPKNPGEYIHKFKKIIKPGGLLFIACPNIKSFSSLIKNFLEFTGIRKSRAKHYDTWQHLIYYSPQKLKRVLEKKYDFNVVKYGNCVEINMKNKKPSTGMLPFAYKSTFRLIAIKD